MKSLWLFSPALLHNRSEHMSTTLQLAKTQWLNKQHFSKVDPCTHGQINCWFLYPLKLLLLTFRNYDSNCNSAVVMVITHMASVRFHLTYQGALFCSYLFIFSIDIHCLGADGLADVVDVVFSAVVKDVLVLFPESDTEDRERQRESRTVSQSFFWHICESDDFLWFHLPWFWVTCRRLQELLDQNNGDEWISFLRN